MPLFECKDCDLSIVEDPKKGKKVPCPVCGRAMKPKTGPARDEGASSGGLQMPEGRVGGTMLDMELPTERPPKPGDGKDKKK